MPKWFENAEDQLVKDLNEGIIDRKTFDTEMHNLHRELRESAQEASDQAYENFLNG